MVIIDTHESNKYGYPSFSGFGNRMLNNVAGIPITPLFITVPPDFGEYDIRFTKTKPPKRDIGTATLDYHNVNGVWYSQRCIPVLEELLRTCWKHPSSVAIICNQWLLTLITGHSSAIGTWRGSVMRNLALPFDVVIPTWSPNILASDDTKWTEFATDIQRAVRLLRPHQQPAHKVNVCVTYDEAAYAIADTIKAASNATSPLVLSVDIETHANTIDCIGFAINATEMTAHVIPILSESGLHFPFNQTATLIRALKQLFEHPNIHILGQNFSYDFQYLLSEWHIAANFRHDTMLQYHALNPVMQKSLNYMASMELDDYVYWKDDRKEADLSCDFMKRWIYNGKDVVITAQVFTVLQDKLRKSGLAEIYRHSLAVWWPVMFMQLRGVRIDPKRRNDLIEHAKVEVATARAEWFASYPDVSPSSPLQLVNLFYHKLKYTPQRNPQGGLTVSAVALDKLAELVPNSAPINALLRLRKADKQLSMLESLKLSRGRLHTSYNVCGAITGRFSSELSAFGDGGNLQNIPAALRAMFVPDPGYVFDDRDMAGADAQVVAWTAGDEDLKGKFRRKEKIHILNIKDLWGLDVDKSHPLYPIGKRFIHGTNYGAEIKTLSAVIQEPIRPYQNEICQHLGVKEATPEMIAQMSRMQWMRTHPAISDWHRRVANGLPQIVTAFGRRCHFHGRYQNAKGEPDRRMRNQALAYEPQSCVGHALNLGLVRLWNWRCDDGTMLCDTIEPLMQVHDSICSQGPEGFYDRYADDIAIAMSVVIPFKDPLVISMEAKRSPIAWSECKSYALPTITFTGGIA